MPYTEEQKARLRGLVDKWLTRLNAGYTIDIYWDEEPDSDSAILSIEPVDGRAFAVLRVGTFFDRPEDEQENAVCHEIHHCIMHPVVEAARLAMFRLSPEAFAVADQALRLAMERVVDHLSSVHAPLGRRSAEASPSD